MKFIKNEQYENFILSHVVRPYQGMLWVGEKTIKRIVFRPEESNQEINYKLLICHIGREWFSLVVKRISKIYKVIDFSFFPNDQFARTLRAELIKSGVKEMALYNDIVEI
jgi:hypothetical protein